jgi:poly [ADP-ribose] polymerase
MTLYALMKVSELREECESIGLDSTGNKKALIERLETNLTAGPPAAGAAPAAASTATKDIKDMKVGELKEELAGLGEPTSGAKAELVARLLAARAGPSAAGKRPASAPDARPSSKKAKASGKAAWFWAADAGPNNNRQWTAYPPTVCAELEAAFEQGRDEVAAGPDYTVSLKPHPSHGHFLQFRATAKHLTRPVTRTADGAAPSAPPPPPPGASPGSTKSTALTKGGGAGKAPAAAAAGSAAGSASSSAAAAAASSSGVVKVHSKSVKPGGVQQVRYASTAGTAASKSGGMKKEIVKGRAAVDPSCPSADDCHVYYRGDDVYDALLNQTDIGANKNKYYIIQLLETDASPHQYYTWNRWGRVGEERGSQNALRGPMDVQAALADFTKKFADKTKNEWSERADFETMPNKYTLIMRDYGGDDEPDGGASASSGGGDAAGGEPAKPVESKLDKRVQDFMTLIADIKMMEQHMREIGFDPNKMPLGKLKKETLLQGYEVLQELSKLIAGDANGGGGGGGGGGSSGGGGGGSSGGGASSSSSGRAVSNGGSVAAGGRQRVLELSNRFYSIIPHTSAGDRGTRQPLEPIATPSALKAKIEMIEALGNIELASRVIDTKSLASVTHPIDARYAQLKTELTPIDKGSSLHKMLSAYLQNTHGKTHADYTMELDQAFEVQREGEEAPLTMANRQLLWHGSRLTNWCGILAGGLRIAPPEAPVTGYMFGKGVYFANMSSKSANYCFANRAAPTGVLLLCDVALGKQYERLSAEYEADRSCRKAGADSTWGKGRTQPDPAGCVSLPGEPQLRVPMGKGMDSGIGHKSTLLYDEFIVYDTAQVRQKYVLTVKFQFKARSHDF